MPCLRFGVTLPRMQSKDFLLCTTTIAALCFTSCAKKEEAPKAVYKIVSYRAEPCGDRVCGGEWTVSRVGMQPKVKMTLVCSFYKWGQRERVEGPALQPARR